MANPRGRRSLLRTAVAAGGAALAGCSALPSLSGGDERATARDWLYDPTAFAETSVVTLQFESPVRIAEHREQLHPEVRAERSGPMYAPGLDPAATDWAIRIADDLLRGPIQTVYRGDFGATAARGAATAAVGDGVTLAAADPVADLEHRSDGDAHVGYREGLAVAVRGSGGEFRRLVEGAANRTDRLAGAGASVPRVLDALGFDHTAQAAFAPQDDGWQAMGTGYRVDGETTTVRLVVRDAERTAADLRGLGESIDGLREVNVAADGPVLTLTAVADTDRVGLRGAMFQDFELPYG